MNYIVFDLEWNQCPDGKQMENPQIPFEILEIGAVKLNEKKEETDRFHEYIMPTVYPRIHSITRELLHLTPDRLFQADPFPAVIARFMDWCGEDPVFCTWGPSDLLELQRNMRFHNIANPFSYPLTYYDIQKIFSLTFEDGKSRKTLEYAMDALGFSKDLPFHEALSDAIYTANVMKSVRDEELLPFYSIDYFRNPKTRKEEISCVFPNYSKFVSKEFDSKTDVMRDRKVASTRCYLCGRHAKKKIRWFANGNKNYICLAYCEEHGYLKGKIRLKKSEDQTGFFCVKTLKLISEAQAQTLYDRQETLRERKRIKRHQSK